MGIFSARGQGRAGATPTGNGPGRRGPAPAISSRSPSCIGAGARVAPDGGGAAAGRLRVALACAVLVVALMAALAFASRALEARDAWTRYPPALVDRFSSLVRFAAQGSVVAAQDQNPVVALLHANSALAHARVARTLLPARDAERIARVDLDELVLVLEEQQLEAMQRIHAVCPALQPDGVAAVATGWLG